MVHATIYSALFLLVFVIVQSVLAYKWVVVPKETGDEPLKKLVYTSLSGIALYAISTYLIFA